MIVNKNVVNTLDFFYKRFKSILTQTYQLIYRVYSFAYLPDVIFDLLEDTNDLRSAQQPAQVRL